MRCAEIRPVTYADEGDSVDQALNEESVTRDARKADRRAAFRGLPSEQGEKGEVDHCRYTRVFNDICKLAEGICIKALTRSDLPVQPLRS